MGLKYDFDEAPQEISSLPATTETLDVQSAKMRFYQYDQEIDRMLKEAQAFKVSDEPSNKLAVTMGTQAKKLYNTIEAQRKEVTEAPNTFVKGVNNFCKEFTKRLKDIETTLKGKISTYQYQEEMKRREAERKAKAEAEKLQAKLDKEAKKRGVEAPRVADVTMPKAESVTRPDEGSRAFQKKRWTFEITNEAEVPREYCKPDPSAIRQAVTMGMREIPGVRIFEEASTVFRTS